MLELCCRAVELHRAMQSCIELCRAVKSCVELCLHRAGELHSRAVERESLRALNRSGAEEL